MKKYQLTEEHRAQLKPYSEFWIKNAMSTKAMDDEERAICREAVKGLYRSANLDPPPDHRIIFVSSPFILRFAAGFAAAIWYSRKIGKKKTKATYAATSDATSAATYAATYAATRAATSAATRDATDAVTRAATYDATDAVTSAATSDATSAATRDATSDATSAATRAATSDATRDATYAAMSDATSAATRDATSDATRDATSDATRAATYAAMSDATSAATRDATSAATRAATSAATRDATDAVTRAATYDETYAAMSDATSAATRAATSDATRDATRDATSDATRDATRAATYAAMSDATYAATDDATYAATRAATSDATDAATYDATSDATRDATDDATRAATYAATSAATDAVTRAATNFDKTKWYQFPLSRMIALSNTLDIGQLGLSCASSAYNFWQGGNQWSGWASFLGFFKNIVKLKIDYSKYEYWEKLALHSGPRIMHEKFCMISDRPKTLKINERNQNHCEDGPFCEWRDGSALYSLNGIRVPMWAVETPKEQITKEQILGEKNTDIRREIIRRIGMIQLAKILEYKKIDSYRGCDLISFDIGDGRVRPYLLMKCPTSGQIYIEGAKPDHTSAKQAYEWQHGLEANEELEIIWQA